MYAHIRHKLQDIIRQGITKSCPEAADVPILIETPSDKQHGDFSCNCCLQLSRVLKKSPMAIAQQLAPEMEAILKASSLKTQIAKMETKAGFMNFYLSAEGYYSFLEDVFAQKERYGQGDFGKKQKFCLEFVSANPTGPLTVAHGRQAAVGDTLVNILNTVGFEAKKEYYINDEGNQIRILAASVKVRILETFAPQQLPEEMYQGDYIKDMARQFIEQFKIKSEHDLKKHDGKITGFAVDYLMAQIKKDLQDFAVHFDIWSPQSKIANPAAIAEVLADLRANGFIYEQDGALWFKSTQWGDDKDRVVKKSNGEYTYLAPDIVYHKNKFDRGFERIVDILGPDHHGYIPRIKAAAGALGHSPDDLDVIIVQLATIFRGGKEVSMSTRRGEFISLREVIDEVGKDAGRFFFLMRQSSAHLEFDLELAKRQSAENPVYYIQYAHARIHSVIRKAQGEAGLTLKTTGFDRLTTPEEMDLMRKIGLYPEVLVGCAKILEPFALVRFLQELAASFHKFYDSHRVLDEDKELSSERLSLIEAARMVLSNGLKLLGVSSPEKM